MSTTMTIRLDDDLKLRLEKLADTTNRSKSFLATEAIRDFVELNEWQVQEIKAAVTEADKGDFATEDAVASVFKKWGVNAN
ncbi:CopG family ribbon-helix-helix protein [Cellvibrio sp. NN19]|uniref:CopG family ribbon-helix-helix protein n=1 Tax=Cellvibrio chitinivorans TaxID=3102792 RepID=UPI002B4034CA|nr:CopG family ribbon-helix-helix protein [Cellvibrio sp. NN19]